MIEQDKKKFENFEKEIQTKIFQVWYPNGEIRTGFFCEIPVPKKEEKAKVLFTTYSKLSEEEVEAGIEIEIFSITDKDKGKKILKDHCQIIFNDEFYNATMIEIFKDTDIINNINFFEYSEEYDYSSKSVFLVDFCSDKTIIYPIGLILKKEEGNMGENDDTENKIEYFCFNKDKSFGGPILLKEEGEKEKKEENGKIKVIGIHYGNNNREGKYWNSGINILNIIHSYYGKNGWRFISKKKKGKQNNKNQACNKNQNDNYNIKKMKSNTQMQNPIQNNMNSLQMNCNSYSQNINYPSNIQMFLNQSTENMENSSYMAYPQNNNNMDYSQNNMNQEQNNMNYPQNNMNQGQNNMSYPQNNMNQDQNNMNYLHNNNNMDYSQINYSLNYSQNNMNCPQNIMNYPQNNMNYPHNNMNQDQNINNHNYNNSMNQNQNIDQLNNMNLDINTNNQMPQNPITIINSMPNKNNINNMPCNYDNKNVINLNTNNNYNPINNNVNISADPNMIPRQNNLDANINLINNQNCDFNNISNTKNVNSIHNNIINEKINNTQNENIQVDNKINSQNTNKNTIQNNVSSSQNTSTDNQNQKSHNDNQSKTNQLENDNKNDSNQNNPSSNSININNNTNKENIKQNGNNSNQNDILDNTKKDKSSKSNEIKTKIITENGSNNNNKLINGKNINNKYNDNSNSNELINDIENKISNKNENEDSKINDNKINKRKTNNNIKEFKDIYSNIDGEKINLIFTMPNKDKKGFKIPSNFTNKEIYFTAYNLCKYQKGEYDNLLKLYYNGNLLNNNDSIEKLENNDEIEIKQDSINSCLDFSDLIKGSTSQIKKAFLFLDIHVELPNDITITEIIDHINSIYNNFLDSNRVKCEIYFKNKILEKKNKEIKDVNRFKKVKDAININIKIKNEVCLQKKPGSIFNVKIFQDNKNKQISEISFGTLEKIKDFFEDLKKELTKKNIKNYKISFIKDGQKLDLNESDERTFFSINVKNDFNCFLTSLEKRKSHIFGK